MKELLIQLLTCPGKKCESHTCESCIYKNKPDCFKALKAEVINALQGEVTIHKPFNLKTRVTEIIHELGIPARLKGYDMVREAIIMAVKDPTVIGGITKVLYPQVAIAFQTTPSRVERAIRHAIEVAWDRGDLDTLHRFFGYTISISKGKPTNSEFVALIADTIRMEVERNDEH